MKTGRTFLITYWHQDLYAYTETEEEYEDYPLKPGVWNPEEVVGLLERLHQSDYCPLILLELGVTEVEIKEKL